MKEQDMQAMVPLQGVIVQRDGKSVQPKVGEPFAFTADEVKDIRAAEKASGAMIVREVVKEESKAEAVVNKEKSKKGGGKSGEGAEL